MKAYWKKMYSCWYAYSKQVDAAQAAMSDFRSAVGGTGGATGVRESAVVRLLKEGKLPPEPAPVLEHPVDLSAKARLSPTLNHVIKKEPVDDMAESSIEMFRQSMAQEMDLLKTASNEASTVWKCRYCPYEAPTPKTLYSHYQFHQQLLLSQSSQPHLEWLEAYRQGKDQGSASPQPAPLPVAPPSEAAENDHQVAAGRVEGAGAVTPTLAYPPTPQSPTSNETVPPYVLKHLAACRLDPQPSASKFLRSIVAAVMKSGAQGQGPTTPSVYASLMSQKQPEPSVQESSIWKSSSPPERGLVPGASGTAAEPSGLISMQSRKGKRKLTSSSAGSPEAKVANLAKRHPSSMSECLPDQTMRLNLQATIQRQPSSYSDSQSEAVGPSLPRPAISYSGPATVPLSTAAPATQRSPSNLGAAAVEPTNLSCKPTVPVSIPVPVVTSAGSPLRPVATSTSHSQYQLNPAEVQGQQRLSPFHPQHLQLPVSPTEAPPGQRVSPLPQRVSPLPPQLPNKTVPSSGYVNHWLNGTTSVPHVVQPTSAYSITDSTVGNKISYAHTSPVKLQNKTVMLETVGKGSDISLSSTNTDQYNVYDAKQSSSRLHLDTPSSMTSSASDSESDRLIAPKKRHKNTANKKAGIKNSFYAGYYSSSSDIDVENIDSPPETTKDSLDLDTGTVKSLGSVSDLDVRKECDSYKEVGNTTQQQQGTQCELLVPPGWISRSVSPGGSTGERETSVQGQIKCEYCGITFDDEVIHSIHMGCHNHADPFICNVCGKSCEHRYGFYTHIMRGHV